MQCVGYKELFTVKDNPASLRLVVDEIKKNTRHYAKRQMTWFRHQVKSTEVNMDDGAFEAAKKMIGEYLKS
jgi:tRNA dimethylallyltransferase